MENVLASLADIEVAEILLFEAKYPSQEHRAIEIVRGVDSVEEFLPCVRF